MKIAVINAGSSSLKFKLFDMQTKEVLKSFNIEHIGENGAKFNNHHEALESIDVDFSSLDAIGHRVVHGGEEFKESVLINGEVIDTIDKLSTLAPLHNPANLEGIIVAKKKAPNIPHIAVFDTAFHSTMPKEAYLYALDYKMYEQHKIRRYGFHGTSHAYVSKEAAKILDRNINELNLITLHLGNGASACAVKKGKSVDTSMGFTPLEGLVMGSRSGDIDPAIVLYMQRELGLSVDEVDKALNKESGLLGICGENDVRDILNSKDEKAKLALDMMIRRIQKYIGSYMALLGRVDAIVFSGGIGENSPYIREKVLESQMFNGIKSLVIKTNEELEIANECLRVLKK
ncbi:MAG: acetate kinase [Epsilonproteobacteria bacterium]|nr:MAG: acetate kinase [Campylobacterota bacterium]